MKIPIILVTGFLGSGKTTFLKRYAKQNQDQRIAFLVNEFAPADIDSERLGETGVPTQCVIGGSLFCNCKAADFAEVMNDKVLALHRIAPLDAVVIETSGIADPEAIGRIMKGFGLEQHFSIRSVICITSPSSSLKLIGKLPNITAQIRSSSLVVINKTDLADASQVNELERQVHLINRDAEIVRSCHCHFEFELGLKGMSLPTQNLSTYDSNPYSTRLIETKQAISRPELETWLEAQPSGILRIKGSVRIEGGSLRIEKSFESTEIAVEARPAKISRLVLITRDEDEQLLSNAVESFESISPKQPISG